MANFKDEFRDKPPINHFNKMVETSVLLGAARLVEFCFGLVKIKFCAIFLGVTGLGIFNQITFLSSKIATLTLLSNSEGLVKQISENIGSDNRKKLVSSSLKSYMKLVTIFTICSMLVLFIISNNLTKYVFGDAKYINYFFVALAMLPILVTNSIPYSLLQGFKEFHVIAKTRVYSSSINIIHSILLIYFYKLNGAALSVVLSHLVTLCFNIYFVKKTILNTLELSIESILVAKVEPKLVKELYHFSGFGLTTGAYVIISEFICRGIVVSHLGIDAIGLYSPVIMWGTLFSSFLMPALTTYLYTSLCRCKDNNEVSVLLNDGLRLATFSLIPFLFFAIPFRELFVSLFFSDSFISVAKLLPYHLTGVVFLIWFQVLSKSLPSSGRIVQHGIFRFMFISLDILVTYYCVNRWGLNGWMLKYLISPFVFYFIYLGYCKKNMGVIIVMENWYLKIYLLVGIFLLLGVDYSLDSGRVYNYLLGPLLSLVMLIFLNENEKKTIIIKFNKILSKYN